MWVETCNSCISTVLSVYTGNCGNLTLWSAATRKPLQGRCTGGNSSFVQFNAVNGQ